jgi:hypothetical protein
MHNQRSWTKNILTWGLVLAAVGAILAASGWLLPGLAGSLALIRKALSATGGVLIVLGIISLLQYAFVRRKPKAGQQMMVQEQDERMQWIRLRAGSRAFWISSALAFFVLNWVSFAGDVGLPVLTGVWLWLSLLVVVVVPFIVYAASMVYDQNRS